MDKIKADAEEKGYAAIREQLRAKANGAKYNAEQLAGAPQVEMTEEERKDAAEELARRAHLSRAAPLWGISIDDDCKVTKIAPNSPAATAAVTLRIGDRLLSVGGVKVTDRKRLLKRCLRLLKNYSSGDTIKVTALRGQLEQVQVVLVHE